MIKPRRVSWAKNSARMGQKMNAYTVLVGKPGGNRPVSRPRCRCEDNTQMDLTQIGLDVMDCTHLAQDRDWRQAAVNTVINL
jgi:hypothetical protein